MKLNNLNKEIELKESRIDSLTKIQVEQLDSIARQTETIEANKVLVKQLSEDLIRLQDPTVKPFTEAKEVPNMLDHKKRQLYDFSIWVNSSNYTLDKISKVSYHFLQGETLQKVREGDNPSNGFLISYRGWGCFPLMRIVVTYKDGTTEDMYFDACEALGWG